MPDYKYCVPVTFRSCVNGRAYVGGDPIMGMFTENVADFKGEMCGDVYTNNYDAAFRSLLTRFNDRSSPYKMGREDDQIVCSNWELAPGASLTEAILYEGRRVSILEELIDWVASW